MRSAESGNSTLPRAPARSYLAGSRVEVEHFDKQCADGGCPLPRRRVEDAPGAFFDFDRVVTVLDGHGWDS